MFEEPVADTHDTEISPALAAQIMANRQRWAYCEELETEITTVAGHLNAVDHYFLKLLADFDEQGGWQIDGVKTFPHWLNWKCGLGALEAREKVRVARALKDLPLIDEAFRVGEISYSKVRAMTRVATPDNESLLLQIAQHGTAQHVEQTVRKYRRCRELDNLDTEWKRESSMTSYQDETGMYNIKLRLPAHEGELVMAAVQKMVDHLSRDKEQPESVSAETSESETNENVESVSAETLGELREPDPNYAGEKATAFARIAEVFLSGQLSSLPDLEGLATSDTHQLIVHVNANEAHRDHQIEDGPCCYLDHNRFLSPNVARQLACDAMVTTVIEDDNGRILNIGRRSRTIPRAIKTALKIRDGGCRFPNCHQQVFTDAHHIHHWADGGETSLDNLVTLCRHHHTLLHKGDFTIVRNGNALTFYNTQINPLTRAYYPQFPNQGDGPTVLGRIRLDHELQQIDINETTAVTRWEGEQIDYGLTVDSLAELDNLQSVLPLEA